MVQQIRGLIPAGGIFLISWLNLSRRDREQVSDNILCPGSMMLIK